MGRVSAGSEKGGAAEFMQAVYDLFQHRYDVYVLEHDAQDNTYKVTWYDAGNVRRHAWLTQTAFDDLQESWTRH